MAYFDEDDAHPNRRLVWIGGAFVSLVLFALVVALSYRLGASQGGNSVAPVITAESGPVKVAPEDRGGTVIPHTDIGVYSRMSGEAEDGSETLMEADPSAEVAEQVHTPQDAADDTVSAAGPGPLDVPDIVDDESIDAALATVRSLAGSDVALDIGEAPAESGGTGALETAEPTRRVTVAEVEEANGLGGPTIEDPGLEDTGLGQTGIVGSQVARTEPLDIVAQDTKRTGAEAVAGALGDAGAATADGFAKEDENVRRLQELRRQALVQRETDGIEVAELPPVETETITAVPPRVIDRAETVTSTDVVGEGTEAPRALTSTEALAAVQPATQSDSAGVTEETAPQPRVVDAQDEAPPSAEAPRPVSPAEEVDNAAAQNADQPARRLATILPVPRPEIASRTENSSTEPASGSVERLSQQVIAALPPAGAPAAASTKVAAETAESAATEAQQQTAAVAPQTSAPVSGYMIQVSSNPSKPVAEEIGRDMVRRHPDILGEVPIVIQRADLGQRGIYYRTRFGPVGSQAQATNLCKLLDQRGQACIPARQ